MKRVGIVRNGILENIVVWDVETPWDPGPGVELVDLSEYPTAQIDYPLNYEPPSLDIVMPESEEVVTE